MKSYKEMSELVENKINQIIEGSNGRTESLYFLVDSWISFSERDQETPQELKKAKAEKMLEYIEKRIEKVELEDKDTNTNWMLNLTITYIGLRQMIEPLVDGEREAHIVSVGI